jgi:hypothetical protein
MRLIFITALFLIPLFGFSSFPTTENGAYDISNTINFQMDEHEQFSFEFLFPFLKGILGSTLMYLLWKWVKKKENRNLSNGKINWNKLHWACKVLFPVMIILFAALSVLAIIYFISES